MSSAILILVCSLGLGFFGIVQAYVLQRRYPAAFLPAYLGYLISSVVYGLFNWTAIPWIADILPRGSSETLRVALILAALAFPFLILRVILLLETVFRWTHVPRSSLRLAAYCFFSLGMLVPYALATAKLFSSQDAGALRSIGWIGTVAIGAQYLAFLYALIARDIKNDSIGLRGLRVFAGINLFCFSVYALAAFWGGRERWLRVLLPILFFAALIPPLLYVRYFLAKKGCRLKDIQEADDGLSRLADSFQLSPREQDIVRLILAGKTNKEIASALFISPHTVKNATSRIYHKTEVRSRGQLASKLNARRS